MDKITCFNVYGEDKYFFSAGITREFGENKAIRLNNGKIIISVVEPLKPHHNLPRVGEIYVYN